MKRYVFALLLVAAPSLTCVNSTGTGTQLLVISPLLDSTFVGETLPPRTVYLLDADGNHENPGHVTWSISPTSVATIDTSTGKIAAVGKGTALVVVTVSGVQSGALVAVSRPLDVTLLLDTILLMPGDTITPPLAIKQQTVGPINPPQVRFDSSPTPSVYTIDTVSGRITALTVGGPVRLVARLTNGTQTVADTGGVQVLTLLDTTRAGQFYMTAFGIAIRHRRGVALGINYTRPSGVQAFQLQDTVNNGVDVFDSLAIVLPDSVLDTLTSSIDSISVTEANPSTPIPSRDPKCNPPRPWAVWNSLPPAPGAIQFVSRGTSTSAVAGQLIITQFQPPAGGGGGAIISGRYEFRAQRSDLYTDPIGAVIVRGTFVAPLLTRTDVCQF